MAAPAVCGSCRQRAKIALAQTVCAAEIRIPCHYPKINEAAAPDLVSDPGCRFVVVSVASLLRRSFLQVGDALIDRLEQLLELFDLDAGERYTQVGCAKRDRTDAVLIQQMGAELLGVDRL